MARYVPEGLKQEGADAPAASEGPRGPALGVRGWLRWGWRQLTSMRVALMLLLLLAVVALPGSFFPQRPQNPEAVAQYLQTNPDLGPFLDRIGMFDVYGSPWFSAVYLLLFISLIGCIVPRTFAHAQAMRTGPSRVPRNFSRFPVRARLRTSAPLSAAVTAAESVLGRGYKRQTTDRDGVVEISAERGYGRETGNLVFHLALVGLLVVTAWGQLVQYRGQAVVVEGDSAVNSAVDYDSFTSGAWFDSGSQEPFRIRLEEFTSRFTDAARPDEFIADVTLTRGDGEVSTARIEPNSPLSVGSARVYLTGNGYAPVITVTDASGEVAFSGPVLFLPQDTAYTSTGVILVPDANRGEPQLGFSGQLYPTALRAEDGTVLGSTFPLPQDPVLILNLWTGDLGLDDGAPQNLFTLDIAGLEQAMDVTADGSEFPLELELAPGDTVELPDGQGAVTFSELRRFAALDVRWDPSVPWMGVFAALAFLGLAASLFMPRRRIWLRIEEGASGTVVHAAALARGDDPGLQRELDRVTGAFGKRRTTAEAKNDE
ncbi:cytochrome c biogenesis protein ResB [Pseudactinotalea suaedae]|uniref:cytochrome c biogenesis protein ResB n=1 Tax=Pseudactinotalea suaedae TaxID=1524924 RepID=UPI0012E23E7D|nr:cytochrome c biogenesis protein ResB [Pseudactinotalea suaedae]